MSWHPLRRSGTRRRTVQAVLTTAALGLLTVTVVLIGARGGYPVNKVRLLSGSAWLPSASVGQLTLLDGSSAEVAAQVQVAARGDRLDSVQQGANAYAVNRTTGTIRRIDGATFELSQPATPIPDARDGLQALAAPDALYALDAQRGVLTTADPLTLAGRGGTVPLASEITPQAATVDGAGRLWVLDPATGDLIWIDNGRRHTRRAASQPGSGLLALADGAPVLIDTSRRTATVIDPGSGGSRGSVDLDLRADDRIHVSGSPHSSRLYVVAARGVLTVCDLTAANCAGAVPLGAQGGDLGDPVETGRHLFIPDYATGKVWIVDLESSTVVAQPQVLTPKTRFQLITRDGVVFFNDPNSEHAGVIHLDGGVQPIAKYNPKDPTKGLTTGGPDATATTPPPVAPTQTATTPPSTPPTTPPADTPPPDQPQPPTDHATPPVRIPPGSVQISVSKTSVRVGEDVTLKVLTGNGQPPRSTNWTYGDGQAGTGTLVTHHWSAAKTYQVSVGAVLAGGQHASASVSISVVARPQLTVRVTGHGTVTGTGVSCPPTCAAAVEFGQSITLTAQPAAGTDFAGWGGACHGTDMTCTLVVRSSVTVRADFRAVDLSAPVQTSPADGQLFTHFPRTTTLKWQPVTGAARYNVEIQCDTCGATPWETWRNVTVTGTSYTFDWVGDNTGRWRVTAVGPNGPGPSSGFRTFKYRTAPQTLPAPVQTSPADGQLFTHFPRTTTLKWQPVTGAARYNVEIQCDTCGATPWETWRNVTVTGTSYTFDWVGDNTGRWRVTAIAGDGTRGDQSGFRTFRYRTAPSTLPAPVQTSPANGQVFTTFPRTTTLRWQPVSGAARYNVLIQCDICGATPWETWQDVTVTGTSHTFDWVGAQSGRWRVTAIAPDGTRGTPSGFRTFRYTQ